MLDFRGWCVRQNIRFAAAARLLEIQPTTLSEVLNGRNNFNSDTTIRVLELLVGKNMKSPKNLNEANEMLDALQAENDRLKLAGTNPTKKADSTDKSAANVTSSQTQMPMIVHNQAPKTELDRLRAQLNTEKDPEKIDELYRKIRSLRPKRY